MESLSQPSPDSTVIPGNVVAAGLIIADRYQLREPVGEGGMGTVWLAEQREPVRRMVAVKLIKPGMDSRQVLARFDAERQALAMMDHPNIARVFDGGVLHDGRPYFAMELVRGVPLTDYCDQVQFSVRERLELFCQVCSAVQHAHQKGIIHRDLKPTNVLVTEHDGRPVVKVIDFGLAKALYGTHALTELSIHTGYGVAIGTPLYMAPEQLGTSAFDIDTRADLYSMGVILYELLTGTTPIERQRLKDAAWDELCRLIREEEPPRPSHRLSSSNTLPKVAARRHAEPSRLTRLIRGELDWIIMKALEKDRNRRYETASGLGMDLQRYLNGEAVLAAPPSRLYRMRKFIRRHRTMVLASGIVFLALVAGVIGTSAGLLEARAQRKRAEHELKLKETARLEEARQRHAADEATQAADLARQSAERAQRQAETARQVEFEQRKYAEAINQFVVDDFLALTSVEGQERFDGKGLDRDSTLTDLLDRAAEKLRRRTDLSPAAAAELCWIIGVNYRGIGEARKGIPFLERSVELRIEVLGPDHSLTLYTQTSLAACYTQAGLIDQATALYESTLKAQETSIGRKHRHTIISMCGLAVCYQNLSRLPEALSLLEEAEKNAMTVLGPEHAETLTARTLLANVYLNLGDTSAAVDLFEETLCIRVRTLGSHHRQTIAGLANLAAGYRAQGRIQQAVLLLEEHLRLQKSIEGEDHPDTLVSMNNLAMNYQSAGRIQDAVPLLEETLRISRIKLGPSHHGTLAATGNLGVLYFSLNRMDEAMPLFEEALEQKRRLFGENHLETLLSMDNLGSGFAKVGQLDKAIPLFEHVLSERQKQLTEVHPQIQESRSHLASAYLKTGRAAEGIELLELVLETRAQTEGEDHPDTVDSLNSLALAYIDNDRVPEAIEHFTRLAKILASNGYRFASSGIYVQNVVDVFEEQQQFAAADEVRKDWLDALRASGYADSPEFAAQLALWATSLIERNAWSKAESVLIECHEIRSRSTPDSWLYFNTESVLGEVLMNQQRYDEAERLLLSGFEGLKARESSIPPQALFRLEEAVDRLIELNTLLNRQDEVDRWKKEKTPTP